MKRNKVIALGPYALQRHAEALRRRRQAPPPDLWTDLYRRYWAISLDRLSTYLGTLKELHMANEDLKYEAPADQPVIILTRTFRAPRALVWKALSEPEHIIRWFGPHRHANKVLAFDFVVGGRWRFQTTTADGQVLLFHGEFRDIVAPEKLVQTFGLEGMWDGGFSVDTTTLEERDGVTYYRQVSLLPDLDARAGMLASMDIGVREGFERLEAMLEEFKSAR